MDSTIVGGLITGAIILSVVYFPFRNITVLEYEKVLFYRFGRFRKEIGAGMHWYCSWFLMLKKVYVRPKFVTVSGQEVTTADGIVMKVSIVAEYQITDLNAAINKIANPYEEALYLVLQLALRHVISSVSAEDFFHMRDSFAAELMAIAGKKAQELGLSIILVELKDITLPGEFKKMFAEVTKAKLESKAILERTHAETAALRSLANAAAMVKDNPALIHLRLLQSTGNTYVVGLPGL
jgi:regulator of protease activity HflC (stomatin/prohibitin superfamily)